MFGATTAAPAMIMIISAAATTFDRQSFGNRADVVVLRSERRRVSWQEEFADFLEEARLERKLRYREDRCASAARRSHLAGTAPLAERLYVRPRRTGRAVGSRHRVML